MTDIPVPNGVCCSSEANEGLLHFRTQPTQQNVKNVQYVIFHLKLKHAN
jgi:hypothetical protein